MEFLRIFLFLIFFSFSDDTIPVPTIEGALPKPGAYVLVAHYYQPERPRNTYDFYKNKLVFEKWLEEAY